jgi:hypothetical protein
MMTGKIFNCPSPVSTAMLMNECSSFCTGNSATDRSYLWHRGLSPRFSRLRLLPSRRIARNRLHINDLEHVSCEASGIPDIRISEKSPTFAGHVPPLSQRRVPRRPCAHSPRTSSYRDHIFNLSLPERESGAVAARL